MLHSIRPLWEQLNQIHLTESSSFKEHYRGFTFEKRCEKFRSLPAEDIFIEGMYTPDSDTLVGYCIATAEKETGEIDSLYIEVPYRGSGYGSQLVTDCVEWLKNKGCTTIRVAVAQGHETVFPFYQKNGFYPRMTILQLKEK